MAEAAQDLLAVTDKTAGRLARISMRQLRYWEQTGLVVPSVRCQVSKGKTVRLYSFQDLLEFLVAEELRHQPGSVFSTSAGSWRSCASGISARHCVNSGSRLAEAIFMCSTPTAHGLGIQILTSSSSARK